MSARVHSQHGGVGTGGMMSSDAAGDLVICTPDASENRTANERVLSQIELLVYEAETIGYIQRSWNCECGFRNCLLCHWCAQCERAVNFDKTRHENVLVSVVMELHADDLGDKIWWNCLSYGNKMC